MSATDREARLAAWCASDEGKAAEAARDAAGAACDAAWNAAYDAAYHAAYDAAWGAAYDANAAYRAARDAYLAKAPDPVHANHPEIPGSCSLCVKECTGACES